MKKINLLVRNFKLQIYGILFYLNIINSEQLYEESDIKLGDPKPKKKVRRWRTSERVVAAYLAIYGYPEDYEITESQVAYLIDRSVIGLRRKISRYRHFEKTGDRKGLTSEDIEIIGQAFSLNSTNKNKRRFAQCLFTAGRSNDRQDREDIQDIVNEMFASTYHHDAEKY